VLEWREYQAVLGAMQIRDRLVARVAGACAVRPEELFAFRWKCFAELPNGRMALLIQETVYRGQLRDFAKTTGSQDYVALPLLLAEELKEWREMARYSGDDDFVFPNSRGGFISKDNYLNRVLYPVRDRLKLKKLNFQVLRRTFATRAYGEHKGTLKDVQKHLRHSKPSTSLENYIKEVPDSVFQMVDAMYDEMIAEPKGPVQ
jgi:integrase